MILKNKIKAPLNVAAKLFGLKYLPLRLNHVGQLKIMLNNHLGCLFQLHVFKTDHF